MELLKPAVLQQPDGLSTDNWRARFWAGEAATMAELYREHFDTVRDAVAKVLSGADRETAIHEVFLRLLANEDLRRSYGGSEFRRWLFSVARNHAIDCARRRARELPEGLIPSVTPAHEIQPALDARHLIARFRSRVLPPEWQSVFEVRFLNQLDQRSAAKQLGIPRTTLLYRELRIRRMLRAFLLGDGVLDEDG